MVNHTIEELQKALKDFDENLLRYENLDIESAYIAIDCIRSYIISKRKDVQPVNRWISVKDRLPEEIGYYLVVIGNEMLVSIDIAEYSENHWHKHDKVLYWQPLPEIPEEAING